MNEITDGGPAFPGTVYTSNEKPASFGSRSHSGISMRDYFAAKWLQGWVANAESPDMPAEKAAAYAYAMADAMLKARQA